MQHQIKEPGRSLHVAIVGGGVAGASIALYLSQKGIQSTLFEKSESLVSGPPMCHLHAGGNFYRDISDTQCFKLLKQSIDLVRFYPYAIDYRPTVIAVPQQDEGEPEALISRLQSLQVEYQRLIDPDPDNKVLGESADYYRLYSKAQLQALAEREAVLRPSGIDEWMIPVAQHVDLESLKFPVMLVQEYGWNLFRLAASSTLLLEQQKHCKVRINTSVVGVNQAPDRTGWLVEFEHNGTSQTQYFDYMVNAAGFRTGSIDDILGLKPQRMVEFKAAYVAKWPGCKQQWPELLFHGERGTPKGMAQFTPYADGYFQLHGMTEEITLFRDGLVAADEHSAQPKLPAPLLCKLEQMWQTPEIEQRTQNAIAHLSPYIPEFSSAVVAGKPLFGAQQIPGGDPTLRAADVSFAGERYARCEIVKASSVLSAAHSIVLHMQESGLLNQHLATLDPLPSPSLQAIAGLAERLAIERNYPVALSKVNVLTN